jgi:hypothetical protein
LEDLGGDEMMLLIWIFEGKVIPGTVKNDVKTYVGVEEKRHSFVTSVLSGGEQSSSRPSRFTPGDWWTPEPV